jgi:hypothetical protein
VPSFALVLGAFVVLVMCRIATQNLVQSKTPRARGRKKAAMTKTFSTLSAILDTTWASGTGALGGALLLT